MSPSTTLLCSVRSRRTAALVCSQASTARRFVGCGGGRASQRRSGNGFADEPHSGPLACGSGLQRCSGGQPLPLPRTADPAQPSFERLVASVTRDVRPRAVLDEWLDRKLVVIDDQDRAVLVEAAYVPRSGDDQQLYYLGRNLHDHIAAAVANVEAPSPPFLERAVHYDGLTKELAEQLQRRSREVAMQALQTAQPRGPRRQRWRTARPVAVELRCLRLFRRGCAACDG